MKRLAAILLIAATIAGCGGDDEIPVSGIDTIDNTLYGTGPYYALGFSFATAASVSSLAKPGPDIVLYMNSDNPAQPRLTFQADNFQPSFCKKGDYPDAASATAAFNNLTETGQCTFADMADPVLPNQVWVFRSGEEKYTKIRIVSTVSEQRPNLPFRFGECTFEWVHQPDGTTTFPAK